MDALGEDLLLALDAPRFSTGDPGPEAALRTRLCAVALAGAQPDARTLLLLSLIHTCHFTNGLFAAEERAAARRRVKDLVEGEQIGEAVDRAIAEVVAAVAAVTAATSTVVFASGARS